MGAEQNLPLRLRLQEGRRDAVWSGARDETPGQSAHRQGQGKSGCSPDAGHGPDQPRGRGSLRPLAIGFSGDGRMRRGGAVAGMDRAGGRDAEGDG